MQKHYTFWHRNTSLVLTERNPGTLPHRVVCHNGAGIPRLGGQRPLSGQQWHSAYGHKGVLTSTATIPSVSRPRCWAAAAGTKRRSLTRAKGASIPHHPGRVLWTLQRRPLQRKGWRKRELAASTPSANLQLNVQHWVGSLCIAYLSSSILF